MYESPYWVGWAAGSWGVSWGYDSGGNPIEVFSYNEVPGGHWKHLFKPAYGVEAPAVKAECASACRVALPDVSRISVSAETAPVSCRGAIQCRVSAPFVGTVTVQVGEECGSAFRVVKPRCYAKTPFTQRADSYSLWMVSAPFTGCGTSVEFGFVRTFTTVVAPFAIQNPSDEMLLAVFS